jgi:hypothetical protein
MAPTLGFTEAAGLEQPRVEGGPRVLALDYQKLLVGAYVAGGIRSITKHVENVSGKCMYKNTVTRNHRNERQLDAIVEHQVGMHNVGILEERVVSHGGRF